MGWRIGSLSSPPAAAASHCLPTVCPCTAATPAPAPAAPASFTKVAALGRSRRDANARRGARGRVILRAAHANAERRSGDWGGGSDEAMAAAAAAAADATNNIPYYVNSNPRFTGEFKAAFLRAQRPEGAGTGGMGSEGSGSGEKREPAKVHVDAGVAEIMARVRGNAQRAAEAKKAARGGGWYTEDRDREQKRDRERGMGTEMETETGVGAREDAEAVRRGGGGATDNAAGGSGLSGEYAAALENNSLFNADFKRAFAEAQERLEEKQAPMWAQIDSEARACQLFKHESLGFVRVCVLCSHTTLFQNAHSFCVCSHLYLDLESTCLGRWGRSDVCALAG